MKFVGQGAQALGQQTHFGGMDGQFARFGFEQCADTGHDIAQIPVFEAAVQGFTHAIIRHINLNLPRAVLQCCKAGFAHHAFQHHAASHAGDDFLWVQLVFGFAVVAGNQFDSTMLWFEVVGKRHAFALNLCLANRFEFLAALKDELVFFLWIVGGWGDLCIGHG